MVINHLQVLGWSSKYPPSKPDSSPLSTHLLEDDSFPFGMAHFLGIKLVLGKGPSLNSWHFFYKNEIQIPNRKKGMSFGVIGSQPILVVFGQSS